MLESKFKQTEIGLIPDGWEVKPLGEVAHIHKGIQFNKADMNTAGSYPVINGGIDASGYIEQYNCDKDTITVSQGGASAGYVNWLSQKFWAGAHCYVVKTNKGVSNKYLYNVLKFNEGTFMNSKYGGNIPALAINTLLNFFVPIPPQEEQERIAGALSSVDELIASLDKQIAKTRDIKQGVMQQLFIGKTDTEHKTLREVAYIDKGIQFNKADMNTTGSYPVINGGIEASGYIEQYNCDKDTITVSQGGASAGYVNWLSQKFWAGAHCYVVKPNEGTNNKYLYYFLKFNELAFMNSKYGGNIPALAVNTLLNFSIPIPLLAEQKHIADVLTSFDDTIEGLEAKRQKYESIKAGMMQQLLTGTIRLS